MTIPVMAGPGASWQVEARHGILLTMVAVLPSTGHAWVRACSAIWRDCCGCSAVVVLPVETCEFYGLDRQP